MGRGIVQFAVVIVMMITPVLGQDLTSSLWIFGNKVQVDFRTVPPLVGTQPNFTAPEGSASVCDSVTGALLFFTDGPRVFDRNGVLVSTDASIRNPSSTQGAIIVRVPNTTDRFIIFAVEDESGPQKRCVARPVQVNPDGSLTIGATQDLDVQVTEKLTAVRQCNGRDYWVLFKKRDGTIRAIPVLPTGLSLAGAVSSPGLLPITAINQVRGEMKVSPDGRYLAAVNENLGTEFYRFNNATGQATIGITFDLGTMQYGCCFSPDSRLLYTNNGWASLGTTRSSIFQFDLSQANIPATKVTVGTVNQNVTPGHMQIAPDGKMYICMNFQPFLSAVSLPNVVGVGCTFVSNALTLAAGTTNQYGLANFPQDIFIPRFTRTDTAVCVGTQIALGLAPRAGYTYQWSPPTGLSDPTIANPTVTIGQTQTYSVLASDDRGCMVGQDVTITALPLPTITGLADTSICPNTSATLNAVVPIGSTVVWSPPTGLSTTTSATTVARPAVTTTYTITVTGPNTCVDTRTVTVTINPTTAPRLSPNGSLNVCSGSSLRLSSGLTSGTFLWSDGSTDSILIATQAGGYRVIHTDANGCITTDSVTVNELPLPSVTVSADTTICAGTTATLRASGGVSYQWSGSGLLSGVGPTVNAMPMTDVTYTVIGTDANGCRDTTNVTVFVRSPLVTSVGFTDTTICPCDSVVAQVPNELITFQWDDGSALRTRTLRGAQQRTITGTDGFGCAVVPIVVTVDTVVGTEQAQVVVSKQIARDGERIDVDVSVREQQGTPSCIGTNATATVVLRTSTILAPANDASRGNTDGSGTRIVTVPLVKTDSTYRAQLQFISTLGEHDSTIIEIVSALGSNGCSISGNGAAAVFALDEICRAGGIARRFLSPNPAANIIGVMPNPVQGSTTVRINADKETSWMLRIEDVLGKTVGGVRASGVVAGNTMKDIPIDVGDLPSGRYVVVLESTLNRSVVLMEVIR